MKQEIVSRRPRRGSGAGACDAMHNFGKTNHEWN